MWVKQSYYDQGEKSGKILAWRIKNLQANRAINAIVSEQGQSVTDQFKINKAFKVYYEKHYSPDYPDTSEDQNSFLDELQFPQLAEDDKLNLDKGFTSEELQEATHSINDGIPIEIYKTFSNKLLPHL